MNILLFDVETANCYDIGSICAIGWVLINGSNEIEHGYSLINPKTSFTANNIAVHGISEGDVKDSPSFIEYWNNILYHKMINSIVVAHNAGFDISALEQALRESSLSDPGIMYVDFLPVCRYYIEGLDHYSLDVIAKWAGYEFNHHNALEDAQAIAKIANAICLNTGIADLQMLIMAAGCHILETRTNNYVPKTIVVHERNYERYNERCQEEVQLVDDTLAGLSFCITGDVYDYSRADVEKMILEHGGCFKSGVTKKLTYLILGTYKDYPIDFISSKHRKALDFNAAGANINFITPDEFLRIVRKTDSE